MTNSSSDLVEKFELLFAPRSVAFLGASNDSGKWGFRILSNLIDGGFQGKIYPVNPKTEVILGLRAYKRIGDIPETPDLAIFVIPPVGVPGAVKECITKGIRVGLVITAGFAEVGEDGKKLEQEIVEAARSGDMILVGPNSFGIFNPSARFHPQMPPFFPPPGPVAIVSQSGNVVGTVARMVLEKGFGCSKCVSSGNEAVLRSQDYLQYLADDPQTKVILCYIEGFKDGARFFEIAKDVTRKKPVVVLKAGDTPAGARAAKSHTSSLSGSDTVFEAMCRQAGVMRARNLDELANIGVGFLCHSPLQGRRVGIVTSGGGWGVLAADACARLGLDVVSLPDETIKELDGFLPAWWSRGNPIDLVAGTFGETMMKCVEILLRCPVVDGVIVMGLVAALPQEQFPAALGEEKRENMQYAVFESMTHVFDQISGLSNAYQKPIVIASEIPFAEANLIAKLRYSLGKKHSVCYDMPHEAAAALASLAQYSEYLRQNGA